MPAIGARFLRAAMLALVLIAIPSLAYAQPALDAGTGSGGTSQQDEQSSADSDGETDGGADGDVPTGPRALSLGDYSEAWFATDRLNEGLPETETPPNRATPQATLESFLGRARNGEFDAAAQMLNLNLVPAGEQQRLGNLYANQLRDVIDRKIAIDWASLPDRPDGLVEISGGNDPTAGQPRRSIRFGLLGLDERDVELRLDRIRVGDGSPIWLVSAQTVENIPDLYRAYAPSQYETLLPEWLKTDSPIGPRWFEILAVPLIMLAGVVVGWAVFKFWRFPQRPFRKDGWTSTALRAVRAPLSVLAGLSIVWILFSNVLVFSQSIENWANPLMTFGFVAAVIWVIARAIDGVSDWITVSYVDDIGDEYNDEARRLYTNISIARRLVLLLLVLIGAGIAFSQLRVFQVFGITLLGSAGVLGLVIGFAAQTVLGNILASVQVAMSKPVRIGDAIFYEGNWGYVEEINYTFILIQTWDQRRIVVPVRYFVSHPYENWSIRNPALIKPVEIAVDFRADLDRIREHFSDVLKGNENYDGEQEPKVLVIGSDNKTMTLRFYTSAADSSRAWDLKCAVHEEMIRFIRDELGEEYLPVEREIQLRSAAASSGGE